MLGDVEATVKNARHFPLSISNHNRLSTIIESLHSMLRVASRAPRLSREDNENNERTTALVRICSGRPPVLLQAPLTSLASLIRASLVILNSSVQYNLLFLICFMTEYMSQSLRENKTATSPQP